MRISALPVTLALTLVTACGPHVVSTPAPTPTTGSRIRFAARPDSTELVPARLVSLDADSLVFERFVPGNFGGKWVPGSLPTDSVARLQVKVGRRGNAGRGALIGGVVGLALGVVCAGEDPGWFQPTPEECIAFYTLSGAGTGLLIGAPTLRLRGDYLAIVTLGFGEITYILLINGDRPVNVTGGPSGIVTIDPPRFFGFTADSNLHYYYLFLLGLGLVLFASYRLRDSRIGWAWQAIREDELAARAMGINTTVAKLQAFAMGASFAGIGGSLLASWQRSVFPDNFLFTESINILAMVILGGMGNIWGVAVGAFIVYMIQVVILKNINTVLETIGVPAFDLPLIGHVDLVNVKFVEYQFLLYGIALVLMMLLRPEGLFPSQRRRQELHIAEEYDEGFEETTDVPVIPPEPALAASPAPGPDPSSSEQPGDRS